ncbi:antitoxin Xre-like helix-turn-helix domain-containing protein [Paraburkholderia phosphatilytica]|uniref:type II RES/Xre toxin-antitoxin system antitoxin n=1 Tax=Paraburkholderia phosphatilytica TaxID=2282883 RepID=UPI000E556E7D|nr:antitoxin Xre-like helix-turn-helix domain-containing protein [Paraburkholderia phosphatilytica]
MALNFIRRTKRAAAQKTAVPVATQTAAVRESGRVLDFVYIYEAAPMERIQLIKNGVRADGLVDLATSMHTTKDQLFRRLGLPRATVDRKARNKQNLSQEQSERVIGLMKLVGQVKTMVEQSGEPEGFDAAQWVGQWLEKPNGALGGIPPAELMDTGEGQEVVSRLLARMQSGAYA